MAPRLLLTVDRIPTSCHCSNVRSTVSEGVWSRVRKRVQRQAGSRCEICGGAGPEHPVEVHEAWEFDETERMQRLVRMIALCPSCHEVKHFGRAVQRGRAEEVRAHLAQVNGWSDGEVEEHLRWTATIWRRREEIGDWGLDLAALQDYGVPPPPVMDARARHDTRGARRLRARREAEIARERAQAGPDQSGDVRTQEVDTWPVC